jgi:phage baseplate assembly protein W|tara:strand:- start:1033 stop:1401 length:369 start_codon:yes stop_codon:yes gene_type:complete
MASFSVALPLRRDSTDGFVMIKKFKTLVKQNLKMLILTVPGERIMDPEFGVGLKTYLFQNFHEGTLAEIDAKVREQVAKYLPVVSIIGLSFDQSRIDTNQLGIAIKFTIPNIGATDLLQITI